MQGTPTRLRRRTRLAAIAALAVAGSLSATAAASAAPTLTVSTANGAGGTVVVRGTDFAQSYTPAPGTGAPTPNAGFYLAQGVVSGGTVKLGTVSKWISAGNASTTSRDALASDGSFSTTLPVTTTLDSGNVDCKTTTCVILAWPAQSNPAATGLIAQTNLGYGPSLTSAPSTVASGDAVTVTGSGFLQAYTPAPGTGAPTSNAGFYVAQGAFVNGAFKLASASKWLNPANVAPTTTQDKLNSDGSFSTTLPSTQTLNSGATDCATYTCFVLAWPAQSNPTAANLIVVGSSLTVNPAATPDPGTGGDTGGGSTGTPSLSVSQTSGLSPLQPTTVTVTGSGYKTTPPGIYVAWGTMAGNLDRGAYSPATKYVNTTNGDDASHARLNADGSFSTTLTLAPTFGTTNCTLVQCYVQTFAAQGTDDPSQAKAVAVSFSSTVATPEAAPVANPNLVPDAPAATPAATTSPDASSTSVPTTGKPVVRNGKASAKVSEASTVTFVLRKKVGKRWVMVKTVKVKTTKAGTVSAKLPMSKAGTYRVSIKAVSLKSGKASKTVTKTTTVKAKKAVSKKAAKKG
jgi:hypothetical protein